MITLEAHCRSGHYVASVVPMMDKRLRTEYHIVVFVHGHEVYQGTERSLEEAIHTAKAYLDWQTDQDLDS